MAADTASAASANTGDVKAAAEALAELIVEPMLLRSVAAAAIISGAVIT